MSLLTIWKANPGEIERKHIQQLVGLAGDGALRDGGLASKELREFLSEVPTSLLARYLDNCLSDSFEDSGLVLQDLVNELGARLGCAVTPGLYRGKMNAIGFDGLWKFPDAYHVVVEVKTTDTYSISLDKIASYRLSLIKQATIPENSSILLVVGRKDTGALEAQVRGSRFAWDIRMISADKLIKLVQLKEAADNTATIQKIRTVLTPLELTKVDFIVDLLATAADDLQEPVVDDEIGEHEAAGKPVVQVAKPEKKFTPVAFHIDVIDRARERLGIELKKETRSLFVTPDGKTSVRAVVSRAHPVASGTFYWYAFHPYYLDALKEYGESFVAFGCGGPEKVLLFRLSEFSEWLEGMNTTEKDGRSYWHVHFFESPSGEFELRLKGGAKSVDVQSHLL